MTTIAIEPEGRTARVDKLSPTGHPGSFGSREEINSIINRVSVAIDHERTDLYSNLGRGLLTTSAFVAIYIRRPGGSFDRRLLW